MRTEKRATTENPAAPEPPPHERGPKAENDTRKYLIYLGFFLDNTTVGIVYFNSKRDSEWSRAALNP